MSWTAQSLKNLPVPQRLGKCPPYLQELIGEAQNRLNLDSVRIFGSRARGDAREKSDYDLAFEFNAQEDTGWSSFYNFVEEELPTLYEFDLVDMNGISQDFKKKILDEGIILYERKK